LFKSVFQVFDDLLSRDIRTGKIVGFFKAFVSESEDDETGLVAL